MLPDFAWITLFASYACAVGAVLAYLAYAP